MSTIEEIKEQALENAFNRYCEECGKPTIDVIECEGQYCGGKCKYNRVTGELSMIKGCDCNSNLCHARDGKIYECHEFIKIESSFWKSRDTMQCKRCGAIDYNYWTTY